jgi:hypothetical protein
MRGAGSNYSGRSKRRACAIFRRPNACVNACEPAFRNLVRDALLTGGRYGRTSSLPFPSTSASRWSPPRRRGCELFANPAASRALQSVAVAPYCRFATPVPPHAGQVVTCVSLSRGRFGNKPSGESSQDICPPPWQMGHWRVSSSAIQRSVGFLGKRCCASNDPIIYDSIVAHPYFTASPQNPQIGIRLSAVFAVRWSFIAKRTRP